MNKYIRACSLTCSIAIGLIMVIGCTAVGEEDTMPVKESLSETEFAAASSTKLVEDRSVYLNDSEEEVTKFYLTVTKDNLTAEKPLSWNEFNSINRVEQNTEEKVLDVILQQGTEEGPASGLFGYTDTHANGVISIRGKSTIRAKQKSFKIKLYDDAGLWRDQKTINLVKHAFDSTRMRNKLSFDYFKLVPDFTSLRTQFVHLYVKDQTSGKNAKFVDYGLYTQIEQPNKTFLASHGLDSKGHLYKATSFEFLLYQDALKKTDDPTFDEDKFNQILEVKGSHDHEKLLKMLQDINNVSLPFDEVFDKHFDRDNFLTWMAVNILMDNYDTINQNFLLYSPLNSNKWFFLPWDYDGGWGDSDSDEESSKRRAPWQRGISNYWGNTLQKRFFKNPDNVQQLIDKMKALKLIINKERTSAFIDSYTPIVSEFVHRQPDLEELSSPIKEFKKDLELMKNLPEISEIKFKEILENPQPFYMGDVLQDNTTTIFNWDASYDLQEDDLVYHFQISRNPSFTNLIKDVKTKDLSVSVQDLSEGKYFWKVTVEDAKGNEGVGFDVYEDIEGNKFFGVRQFYVD
ncbi:CotH kinase family protein [Paenibacillus sp. CMAA1364]